MPDPHWEYFQLDPATATEQELKRSYARLLKEKRPDQDAAGFQTLRDAYESAKADLRRREEESSSQPLLPGMDLSMTTGGEAQVPAPGEIPAEWTAFLDSLEKLLKRSNGSDVFDHLKEGAAMIRRLRLRSIAWRDGLLHLGERYAAKLFAEVPQELLLLELAEGENEFSGRTLLSWIDSLRNERINRFSDYLAENQAILNDPSAAQAVARLGLTLGFFHARLGNTLAEISFPHLPPQIRSTLANEIERSASLGAVFKDFHPKQRDFWHRRLTSPPDYDWECGEASTAREYLRHKMPANWPGWDIIAQLVPDNWLLRRTAHVHAPSRPNIKQPDEDFWDLAEEDRVAANSATAPKAPPATSGNSTREKSKPEKSKPEKSSKSEGKRPQAAIPIRSFDDIKRTSITGPNYHARLTHKESRFRRLKRTGSLGGVFTLIFIIVTLLGLFFWLILSTTR